MPSHSLSSPKSRLSSLFYVSSGSPEASKLPLYRSVRAAGAAVRSDRSGKGTLRFDAFTRCSAIRRVCDFVPRLDAGDVEDTRSSWQEVCVKRPGVRGSEFRDLSILVKPAVSV